MMTVQQLIQKRDAALKVANEAYATSHILFERGGVNDTESAAQLEKLAEAFDLFKDADKALRDLRREQTHINAGGDPTSHEMWQPGKLATVTTQPRGDGQAAQVPL